MSLLCITLVIHEWRIFTWLTWNFLLYTLYKQKNSYQKGKERFLLANQKLTSWEIRWQRDFISHQAKTPSTNSRHSNNKCRKNRWSKARNRGERESEHVKRSRTFMLVRRTGDSSSAEGLNPGGIVRHGARAIGSRAGDIDLYLAPFAPASGEAPGSGLPSFPSPDPSNRSSGAWGRPSAAPQPRSPAAGSGFLSISGSNRKWGGRGEWQWGKTERTEGRGQVGGFREWWEGQFGKHIACQRQLLCDAVDLKGPINWRGFRTDRTTPTYDLKYRDAPRDSGERDTGWIDCYAPMFVPHVKTWETHVIRVFRYRSEWLVIKTSD